MQENNLTPAPQGSATSAPPALAPQPSWPMRLWIHFLELVILGAVLASLLILSARLVNPPSQLLNPVKNIQLIGK